jgi:hypothetical protein
MGSGDASETSDIGEVPEPPQQLLQSLGGDVAGVAIEAKRTRATLSPRISPSGRLGEPGWRGRDRWHHNEGEERLPPGAACPTASDNPAPEPPVEPPDQAPKMLAPPPWVWILPLMFIPFPGNPIYGGL